MRRLLSRRKNSQRGAALVEFSLSILVTVFIIFWLFEMVMMVYTYTVIADSAKEGVRYAIVHGSHSTDPSSPVVPPKGPGTANIVSDVMSYAKMSLHDVSRITITPTYTDGGNDPQERVSVTVTYPYVPYLKLPFTSPTISATAEGRIMY